ncbi:MAG: alpha-1,4-glucan--maltose-1-phosphate maltosyltransferase [Rhodospirillaceae bacterium]|nr:alpha-1,4-glucan--maltose-1-phosphate maltosyltransferase [Rhodospirillaceae bacterium]
MAEQPASPAPKAPAAAPKAKPAAAPAGRSTLSQESEARLRHLAPFRFVIEAVTPEIDGGRFPIKREVGDAITVQADIVADGHAKVAACIRYRHEHEGSWHEAAMTFMDNDRWGGSFKVERLGRYRYTIDAWVDPYQSLLTDMVKKANVGQPIDVELLELRQLIDDARDSARGTDHKSLMALTDQLDAAGGNPGALFDLVSAQSVQTMMRRVGLRAGLTQYQHELACIVDRERARFGTWYEMFWRSQGTNPMRGATVDECIGRLDYIKGMGFDVVYIVPHHPIGVTNRKGRNNSLTAGPGDPGSPYAIGSDAGGHMAVNPEWGTLADFDRFVKAVNRQGMEVAIDFAIQCSPDHPWIKQHPDWFKWRPDGTIRYAENPPKKYEDIVNVEFYEHDGTTPKTDLWIELRDIVQFWIDHGVKIFRVDNPHTKALPFWEWLIHDIQDRHPEAIFLAEAFTRPKLMKALAKLGFTQSYSYFTWRTTKWDLRMYLEELTQSDAKEYMRANFFANTPDILPLHLQTGGRPAFLQRAVLAATLNSTYGIYNGFELCEAEAVPGKEEYFNSEKYQYKVWDWDRPGNIREWITRLNMIRHTNPALQEYENLEFYSSDDDNVLVYGKITADRSNFVMCAVNLDPHRPHEAHFELPLWKLNLPDWATVTVEELIGGYSFEWTGKHQHVWIDNNHPAFIWRIEPK